MKKPFKLLIWWMITSTLVVGFSATTSQLAAATATCKVVAANGLYFRPGPALDPPIALLPKNTQVTPRGATKDRLWVQALWQNKTGWLKADTNLLSCTVAISTLPIATPPAAPTGPTPTATPYQIAYTPAPGQNGGGGGFDGTVLVPRDAIDQDNNIIFRDHMVFELRVKNKKNQIKSVEITIFDNNATEGDGEVFHHVEGQAPYCAFGNDSNHCEKIWFFAETGYRWPKSDRGDIEAGNIPINPDGDYTAQMRLTTKNDNNVQWNFDFQIQRP